MRSLLISGVALGAITLFTPVAMAADSSAATIIGAAQVGAQSMGRTTIVSRWGNRINGRWIGGVQAPGGWAAYRRPAVGSVVPSYWIDSAFTLNNYSLYGLPAPQRGYVWARYYDDAVLLDRNGRVYDSRTSIDWDRYEGGYGDSRYAEAGPPPLPYRDGRFADDYVDARPLPPPPYADGGYPGGPPPPTRRGNNEGALAGAVVGGVAGGVLGNVVAGRGNRTAGTILGAGLGAVAGAAIGSTTGNRDDRYDDRPRGAPPPPPGAVYRGPPPPAGDWRDDGRPGEDYRDGPGPMRGPRWMGNGSPPPMAAPMPYMQGPPRGPGPGPGQPNIVTYTTPGYAAGGYWYPGTTVTTITFPPQVTTVTTTKTVIYTTKAAVKKKPAAKARCRCK